MKDIRIYGGANSDAEAPQIEIFKKCLTEIKSENPTMIEIGSNDCFYSILFNEALDNSTNICIEISKDLLEAGKENVKLNELEGFNFILGSVGQADIDYIELEKAAHPHLHTEISKNKYTLKEIYDMFNLKRPNIVHMDICGTEIEVLTEILESNLDFEYMFVSTHPYVAFTSPTHQKCVDILDKVGVDYLFSDEYRGGCGDGLIVCRKKTSF